MTEQPLPQTVLVFLSPSAVVAVQLAERHELGIGCVLDRDQAVICLRQRAQDLVELALGGASWRAWVCCSANTNNSVIDDVTE